MTVAKSHTFQKPFITEKGDTLSNPTVAYKTWGELNAKRDNAVLVCHALTGNMHADKWFRGLFGTGKTLDSEKHFIICPNILGSCYGTTGPVTINPNTQKPYKADFPKITVRDIVRLHQRLLDVLGIRQVVLVIGGSLGGMQALEFSVMDSRAQSAVLIGMGMAHSPWAIGISHTQRQAIYNDPRWNNGYYTQDNPPAKGLAIARMIAMNSYRNPEDFETKFSRNLQGETSQFQVESYLNYQGQKIVERFDAVSYVRLTQAMDTHDISFGRGSYKKALQVIQFPVLVMGIDSDLLYPTTEQKKLAEFLPNATYAEVSSPHGHDGFLIEFEQMNRHIINFVNQTENKIIS